MPNDFESMLKSLKKFFKPHPWHGISTNVDGTPYVNVFVEIVPTDTVKYELDKASGYLCIDRPQAYSNTIPALYGFLPRTYSNGRVAAFTIAQTGMAGLKGDGDPIDVCVLTERPIAHGDLLLKAKVIGGFRMIDKGEVDDKLIAVLKDDAIYGNINDVSDCPEKIISRLKHYFLTYKDLPGASQRTTQITHTYGRDEALKIIELSQLDYSETFPEDF